MESSPVSMTRRRIDDSESILNFSEKDRATRETSKEFLSRDSFIQTNVLRI